MDENIARQTKRPRAETRGNSQKVLEERARKIEEDSPEVIRSVVHTVLPAGHSMVTGGHVLANGDREFAVITPKWIDGPAGSPREAILETCVVRMNPQELRDSGLDSLATSETKSSQNAEVWTPGDVEQVTRSPSVDRLTSPTLSTRPGMPATIRIGTPETGVFQLTLEVVEAADSGSEIKSDMRRVE